MPSRSTSLALALAIMALSAWGVFSALDWPWKAKLFPLVIGIPLFCLATAEALWVIFGKQDAAAASDFKLSSSFGVNSRRNCAILPSFSRGSSFHATVP